MSKDDDDYGATVRAWTDIVRRAELTPAVKGVAYLLVSYADANGRRIFPGIATLSVASGRDYRTIRRTIKALTEAGLLEKIVSRSGVRGRSDEYRLIVAPDILERLKVMSPAEFVARANAIRQANLRSSRTGRSNPVLEDEGTGPDAPVLDENEAEGTGQDAPPKRRRTGQGSPQGQGRGDSNTSHREIVTKTTSHSGEDLRTAVAAQGPKSRTEKEKVSRPARCSHGLKPEVTADGTPRCVFCRRDLEIAEAYGPNVIPFRRDA